ncbi:amine oxidase [flavin-containing] B [Nematostella vectensis]|uniref:amine oxidase [flavin-containing] B n=1 Tax=Nematostella vectensis TaxID=45351 RepID=UPI0020776FCC|nr:amine oxidase [flavin-containing] B [Nematostella vectensis]
MKPSGSFTVAVVGGGVAGLAAAASLIDKGFDVKLLEAADYFGGRVMQALPFPGFAPVDLGAEFIHGDRTILNDIARKQSWKVHRENLLDALVYVDGKSYPCLGAEHPEISACLNEFKKLLAANEDQGTDFLYQRLCDQGLSDVALRFLDNFDVQSRGGTFTYYGLAERRQKESSFKEWGTVNMR